MESIIFLLSLIFALNSQISAFKNKYIINDDVRQHIFWMHKFHDPTLFKNDPMTSYARKIQPWGFNLLYYTLSHIIKDPLIISKILPIILFILSSIYIFKLVKYISNNYAGALASLMFMVSPTFLTKMVGGNARAFGYPLIIIFLYSLIKKRFIISNIIILLQSLFYPTTCLLGIMTYLISSIRYENKKFHLERSSSRWTPFIITFLVCATLLGTKSLSLKNDQEIGSLVSKKQIIDDPAFRKAGRYPVYPTEPLLDSVMINIRRGVLIPEIAKDFIPLKTRAILNLISLFSILYLLIQTSRRKLQPPLEIFQLFLAALILFKMADFLYFKLFIPSRFTQYSIPILSLIITAMVASDLVSLIPNPKIRNGMKIIVLIAIISNFNVNKDTGLQDMSQYKDLCNFLKTLEQDSLIAAPPFIADNIPTFAQRKVFFNFETSIPFFDKHWDIVKKRTYNFFNAYYAKDPQEIYRFCEENEIDYLVADYEHFTEEYLKSKEFYFEPFDSYIGKITKNEKDFALAKVPQRFKIYDEDNLFVIPKDAFKQRWND